MFHARTKHIELAYHFAREKVAHETLLTKHVSAKQQLTDIIKKALPKTSFIFETRLVFMIVPTFVWRRVIEKMTSFESFEGFESTRE